MGRPYRCDPLRDHMPVPTNRIIHTTERGFTVFDRSSLVRRSDRWLKLLGLRVHLLSWLKVRGAGLAHEGEDSRYGSRGSYSTREGRVRAIS